MKTGLRVFSDGKTGASNEKISATVSEGSMTFQNVLTDSCITGFEIKIYHVLDR